MKAVGAVVAIVLIVLAWGSLLPSLGFTVSSYPALAIIVGFVFIGRMVLMRVWGRQTGWQQLAQHYPAVAPRTGRRIVIYRPYFRDFCGVPYRGVQLEAGESHLHFQSHVLFDLLTSVGHPPFSVRWADISAQRDTDRLSRKRVRFNFAGVPDVPFTVSPADAERIVDASHGLVKLRE